MSRGISPATKDALSGNSLQMATLVKMYFTPTGDNFNDYGEIITANITGQNEIYTPDYFFLSYEDVSESGSLQVGELKIDLSVTDTDKRYLNYALDGTYLNRRVIIARAFMNGSTIIGSPFTLFDGRIKSFEFEENTQESIVSFIVSSHWSDFEKVKCQRTNKTSHQRYYPDDTGLNWSAETTDELRWGRKG